MYNASLLLYVTINTVIFSLLHHYAKTPAFVFGIGGKRDDDIISLLNLFFFFYFSSDFMIVFE